VRGKARRPVEFGAKIAVSLVDGMSFVDRISWNADNESGDLVEQIQAYHRRFGHYPAAVHADHIYRIRPVSTATVKGFASQGRPWPTQGQRADRRADEARPATRL